MNVVVVLLLMMGGFLIMDAVGEKRVNRAERETRKTVKYVPMSIYDEQLSGRSMRDFFSNMFYSSGPWAFRNDFASVQLPGARKDDDDALALAFSEMQKERADLTSSPSSVAAERRRRGEEAGLSSDDPLFETYSSVPKTPAERIRGRRARRTARKAIK